MLVSEYSTDVM
jgi:hypothetical protein